MAVTPITFAASFPAASSHTGASSAARLSLLKA